MQDMVENRKRIRFSQKLRLARVALRENGAWWCLLLLGYLATSSVAHRAFAAMTRRRRARNLPGMNSASLNKEIWESWDWSADGDEWSQSSEWKQSLVSCVLTPLVPQESSILEIGPGAGRWTEYLLERAANYIGIDISSTCVAHCKKRFADVVNAQFILGSGADLTPIQDRTIDVIWSFDVFVHINRAEIQRYAREFVRVLRPGGIAIIHHGTLAGAAGGWRSNLTASDLQEILRQCGLRMEASIAQWMDGEVVHRLEYGDLVAVIRKAGSV